MNKLTATDTLVTAPEDGAEGHRGLMPYPCGNYDGSTTYKSDDYITPMVLDANNYYILKDANSQSIGIKPSTNYAAGGTAQKWLLLEKYKAIYVELFMANYGKIASAIFYGDCMFSQQGKDANGNDTSNYEGYANGTFTPNIMLNFLTGVAKLNKLIAENAEISGTMKGVTGSFKTLNCVNAKGEVVGNISFGTDGRMWFDGDMYHQGTKDGRSLRFYTSDIWCRGQFGARQRTVLKILGSYAYYYPNGTNYTGVYVQLTSKKNSANETYYEVPCYGSAGDYSGLPVDTIIFSTTYKYSYELIMADTQRCLVVNAYDDYQIYIYNNGAKITWDGGKAGEVVKVPANMISPAIASTTLGRGVFICGFNDNNW